MESWPSCSIESGNQLSSRDDMGCMELSSISSAEIGVPIDLRRLSQGISVSTPLEAENQGPSHIPIAEGRLLLRYLFKVGLTVQ